MAVTRVTLRWSGRPMSIGARGVTTIRDVYDIELELESGVDPRQMIRDVLGSTVGDVVVPERGQAHPLMSGQTCRSLEVSPNGGPIAWELTASYSNSTGENTSTDPTLRPPDYVWGSQSRTEERDTDIDQKPVATTAGEPFESGIIVPEADTALDVSFNVPYAQITPQWLLSYRNKTNLDTWNGQAPGTVLIDESAQCRYVYATDDTPAYWACTIRFLMRDNDPSGPARNAWQTRRLNKGYRYLDDDGKLVVATDADGMPFNQPILLDALGKPTAVPHWLWFRNFKEVNFAPLSVVLP